MSRVVALRRRTVEIKSEQATETANADKAKGKVECSRFPTLLIERQITAQAGKYPAWMDEV